MQFGSDSVVSGLWFESSSALETGAEKTHDLSVDSGPKDYLDTLGIFHPKMKIC